jgi:hypothetical protein
VGWAAETTPEVLLADALSAVGPDAAHEWAQRVSVPTLVIHGDDDRISPLTRARSVASDTGGELVILGGAGHIPLARDPVRINLLVREFADRVAGTRSRPVRWARARHRRRRALFVSSPIGLGHARRDIAIASGCAAVIPIWNRLARPASGDANAPRCRRACASGEQRPGQ